MINKNLFGSVHSAHLFVGVLADVIDNCLDNYSDYKPAQIQAMLGNISNVHRRVDNNLRFALGLIYENDPTWEDKHKPYSIEKTI